MRLGRNFQYGTAMPVLSCEKQLKNRWKIHGKSCVSGFRWKKGEQNDIDDLVLGAYTEIVPKETIYGI